MSASHPWTARPIGYRPINRAAQSSDIADRALSRNVPNVLKEAGYTAKWTFAVCGYVSAPPHRYQRWDRLFGIHEHVRSPPSELVFTNSYETHRYALEICLLEQVMKSSTMQSL